MNSNPGLSFASHANAFGPVLSLEAIQQEAPAVFASSADERMSARYAFLPTSRVLAGLVQAGFVPVSVRQSPTRSASPLYARHVIRLRRRFETVLLPGSSLPEVVLLNSHDGTSAYQLRMGIFRVVCSNGLIVSHGAFPAQRVAHRGNIVDDVVTSAVQMAERFTVLAEHVGRMESRRLLPEEQIQFAGRALALRYPDLAQAGMAPSQLLTCRRPEDAGDDLWRVLNRAQEHLLQGGLVRHAANGRLIRMRRIGSIQHHVQLNSALWDLAAGFLTA